MKKTNKIAGILILVIVLLMTTINISKATDYAATMSLTGSKTTAKVGDTVTFTLALKSATNVEGVATVHAKINYDKSVLQFVTCESTNSWSAPAYNSENQEFVTERSDVMKPTGEIVKITFKVISIPENNTTTVSITDFDVADTENQITVLDASASLKIEEQKDNNEDNENKENSDNNNKENTENKENTNNTNNNTEKPENTNKQENINIENNNVNNNANKNENKQNNTLNIINQSTNENDTTVQTGKLPQTGLSTIIPLIVAIISVTAVVCYLKYKKMNDIS